MIEAALQQHSSPYAFTRAVEFYNKKLSIQVFSLLSKPTNLEGSPFRLLTPWGMMYFELYDTIVQTSIWRWDPNGLSSALLAK
jgi:hypothetical protein